jgi:hypothetical protein
VESSFERGNEPSGSIKLPSGCTTCGLSSDTQLHRISYTSGDDRTETCRVTVAVVELLLFLCLIPLFCCTTVALLLKEICTRNHPGGKALLAHEAGNCWQLNVICVHFA